MRVIWLAVLSQSLVFGQEETLEWEPRFDGPPPLWTELLGLALLGTTVYVYWRLGRWFIDHRHARPHWKANRYWWPTAMTVFCGLAIANVVQGSLGNIGLAATFLLNLPAEPIVGMVVLVLQLPEWGALVSLWLTWYGIIRFLERRSILAGHVSLSLMQAPK